MGMKLIVVVAFLFFFLSHVVMFASYAGPSGESAINARRRDLDAFDHAPLALAFANRLTATTELELDALLAPRDESDTASSATSPMSPADIPFSYNLTSFCPNALARMGVVFGVVVFNPRRWRTPNLPDLIVPFIARSEETEIQDSKWNR